MTSPTLPELTPTQIRVLAARSGDIEAYAKAVHNLNVEPYQLAWEQALVSEDRVCIVCPPDTYKSTTVQMWVEQTIGRDRNSRILWLMNSGEQAQKRVMTVANTIKQNGVYKAAFPNVREDRDAQWTKTVLYVERDIDSPDPTLMASGLNGPYQGLHFDKIVIDDPTNQEDVRSPTTMELQRSKLRGVILDRLVEGGSIVVILTRWGEDDLVPTLKSMGFRIIQMPVVGDYPWGPTISNRRFPMSRMDQLRRDKTDAIFNLTYMCDPLAFEGSGIIKRDDLRYWTPQSLPDSATLTLMSVDPASSIQHWADPSAIGIGLLDPKSRAVYVTDVFAQRMEVPDFEKELIKRAQKNANVVAIGIETIAYQMSLLQRLRREYRLPFKELRYRSNRNVQNIAHGLDRDKSNRAIYLDSKFISNQIYLPPYDLPLVDGVSLESELLAYGTDFGKHDDRGDVLAFLCALADGYTGGARGMRVRIRG